MGNWFNGLDLGVKYAIALSVLFVLVLSFAFTKLILMKRKQKRFIAAQKLRAADKEAGNESESIGLTTREADEGDLFGIRALEHGFTGGVAQSRPTTPTVSTISLGATLAPGGGNSTGGGRIPYGHASSSTLTLDASAAASGSSSPRRPDRSNVAVDMALTVPESPRMPGPSLQRPGHMRAETGDASRSPSHSPSRSLVGVAVHEPVPYAYIPSQRSAEV